MIRDLICWTLDDLGADGVALTWRDALAFLAVLAFVAAVGLVLG